MTTKMLKALVWFRMTASSVTQG